MVLVIDDIFLPATLSAPPMTDDEFAAFCAEHPDLFFEMTAEGEVLVMRKNGDIQTNAECPLSYVSNLSTLSVVARSGSAREQAARQLS